MTREIKFRAWDKKAKVWLEWGTFDLFVILKNDRYAVVEYTGLKDKNRKEIYEGDICQDDCGHLMEIKFGELPLDKGSDCVCTYQSFYAKDYGKIGEAPWNECNEIGEWFEIIGNIYENPDLLPK